MPAALDSPPLLLSLRALPQHRSIDLTYFADVSRDARTAAARGEGAEVEAPPSPAEEGKGVGSILPAAATLRLAAVVAFFGGGIDGAPARLAANAGRVAGAARAKEPRPSAFMSKAARKGH